MAPITSLHLPRSRSAVLQRTPLAFSGTEVSKAAKRANGGLGSA